MSPRFRFVLLISVLVLGLLSCGESDGPLEASDPPAPSILTATVSGTDASSRQTGSAVILPRSTGTGAASVLVTWTACPDEDFAWYTLYRSGNPDISSNPSAADTSIIFPGSSDTSWTDNSVASGGTFYYALRTTDTEDLVSWSNEESVDVPQDPPPTPSAVTAASTGDDTWAQVTVDWDACPDADFHSYRLYRSSSPDIAGDPSSAELLCTFESAGESIYEDNDVIGDETLYYAVLTEDLSQQSSWSNEAVVTTPAITPVLTVFFIDPSYSSHYSGDAILLRTPLNDYYLIDGGDRSGSWSLGEYRILPLLDSLGVRELEGIVGTHPHADHIGGLIAVLETIPVGTVWDSGYEHTTQTYQDYLEAIEQNGSDYVTPRRGDLLDWGDELTVECLHPVDPLAAGDPNNASVTLRITYDDISFLFTGDLETDGGEEIILLALAQGYIDDISAQVLKVGHHGSSTSTSVEWLQAVQPDHAAIEVGIGNSYGHPHSEVLNRLESFDIDTYRTDLDGTFIMTTDGSEITVHL